MRRFIALAAAMSMLVPATANAAPKSVLIPIQEKDENVRFQQGVPTVEIRNGGGMVQLRPMPSDHNNMSFSVAVFNDSGASANFDTANITVQSGLTPVRVLTAEEMMKKAKSRATWAAVAVALAGGVSAAAAASQRDHYTATTYTPRGTYRTHISTPSTAGQIQAAAITAGTGASLYLIGNQLDRTIEYLGNETVQMTTVDPGDSYGGRVYFTRFKAGALPQDVRVTVKFNGEDYPFVFRLAKKGTPIPQYRAALSDAVSVPASASGSATPQSATPSQPVITPAVATTTLK